MSIDKSSITRAPAKIMRFLGLAGGLLAAQLCSAQVKHTTGTVSGFDANGNTVELKCDIWTWSDQSNHPRTVALKMEGNGNPGHGGYAVQMTYYNFFANYIGVETLQEVTVNQDSGSDGGFGYFVSHERYRTFDDGTPGGYSAPIADYVFGLDSSPLSSLSFAATSAIVQTSSNAGSESFTVDYQHYGTSTPWGLDSSAGADSPHLPRESSLFTLYTIPVKTTWVFQTGMDFPRIDVSVDLSGIKAPGSSQAEAGLVSFDVRGPYGVMNFDGGAGDVVDTAAFGDETNLFTTTQDPVTRSSGWTWNAANNGARYNVLFSGNPNKPGRYEMGMFEPKPAGNSALADGDAAERSFTSATYAAAGLTSTDACTTMDPQTLPSDGNWPYQSVQYSLPCSGTNFLSTPTSGLHDKKIAWGSSSYYGSTLTSVWNGYESRPITAFPSSLKLNYSVCLVLGWNSNTSILYGVGGPPFVHKSPVTSSTESNAALYTAANPAPANSDCATVTP